MTGETLMGRVAPVAVIALLIAIATARADLVGHYKASGTRPDGTPYSGEVAIEIIGNVFHVVREIDGHRYVGTGLGHKNILAVTYHLGNETLLALYVQADSGQWVGKWVNVDNKDSGIERWEPYLPSRRITP
jgi:hypothetical protein